VRAIHVDDLARLCVRLGAPGDNVTLDAVGPQSLTFREMVTVIRAAVGSRSVVVSVPGSLVPPLSAALGIVLRDVLLTRDEYRAMADGLADSDAPSTGETAFTDWVARHGAELGHRYANELELHFRAAVPAGRTEPRPSGSRKRGRVTGPLRPWRSRPPGGTGRGHRNLRWRVR
jgi:hypothetical protein